MNALFKLLAATLALALLSACGGSSSSDDDDPNDITAGCGTVTDISPNGIISGTLNSSDCRLETIFPGAGDPTFVDEFRFTVTMPVNMTITQRSTQIDSFLFLLDTDTSCASGCNPIIVLAGDDDSGGGASGLDSQIVIFLNPGTYIILANSFNVETGSYRIETSAM